MLMLLTLIVSAALAQSQTHIERLRDVRRVYVAPFGKAEGADIIRAKVINRLVEARGIEVVGREEKADAVLVGVGKMRRQDRLEVDVNRSITDLPNSAPIEADLVVRLEVRGPDGTKILWGGEADNRSLWVAFSPSASSSRIADRIVKDLVKAIEKDKKDKKGSEHKTRDAKP
jgi:hypothetical protein